MSEPHRYPNFADLLAENPQNTALVHTNLCVPCLGRSGFDIASCGLYIVLMVNLDSSNFRDSWVFGHKYGFYALMGLGRVCIAVVGTSERRFGRRPNNPKIWSISGNTSVHIIRSGAVFSG